MTNEQRETGSAGQLQTQAIQGTYPWLTALGRRPILPSHPRTNPLWRTISNIEWSGTSRRKLAFPKTCS